MNNKRQPNKVKQIIIITGVITLLGISAGLFYWYEFRPSEIRQECDGYAREKYSNNYNNYKASYTACLHQKGLE